MPGTGRQKWGVRLRSKVICVAQHVHRPVAVGWNGSIRSCNGTTEVGRISDEGLCNESMRSRCVAACARGRLWQSSRLASSGARRTCGALGLFRTGSDSGRGKGMFGFVLDFAVCTFLLFRWKYRDGRVVGMRGPVHGYVRTDREEHSDTGVVGCDRPKAAHQVKRGEAGRAVRSSRGPGLVSVSRKRFAGSVCAPQDLRGARGRIRRHAIHGGRGKGSGGFCQLYGDLCGGGRHQKMRRRIVAGVHARLDPTTAFFPRVSPCAFRAFGYPPLLSCWPLFLVGQKTLTRG